MYWGYGRTHSDSDLRSAFDASVEAGVTFYDTAEIYGGGQSERFLGQFIQESGRQVVVTTKFMPQPWKFRRSALLRSLRASLERLQMEKVDLYLIHWPYPPRSVEVWAEELANVFDAGLVKAVGVSNYSVAQMERAHTVLGRRGIPLAANQVQYSIVHRSPEKNGVLAACREMRVTLVAYSPLGMGVLTGKYSMENPLPGIRGRMYNKRLASLQPLLTLLGEIGQARNKTPAQIALNWVICKGAVPIPGAKNAQQASQNAGALGWRLTDEEVASLDATSQVD
jgi:aryl-alcohol dehydrogenase-like predicted oxidoreductase